MFEQAFRNIDDVLRKEAGCTTELDYTEQTSWLLFLKYLDALEQDRAMEAALEGKRHAFILDPPYRWESCAAPKGSDGKLDHNAAMIGRVSGRNLVLAPAHREYSLQELVAGITPRNRHRETDWVAPVGNESW